MLRSRVMAFRLKRRSLLAGGLLVAACYSPTLPLPPPGKPDVNSIEGKPGTYRLMGSVEPNAEVVARNKRTDLLEGQVTGKEGRYDFEVEGLVGDAMELWYIVGTDASPRVQFTLPAWEDGAGGAGGAAP